MRTPQTDGMLRTKSARLKFGVWHRSLSRLLPLLLLYFRI